MHSFSRHEKTIEMGNGDRSKGNGVRMGTELMGMVLEWGTRDVV